LRLAGKNSLSHEPSLPDFLVIGAQKAGTGSIHAALSSHPEICMPRKVGVLKEIHFFNRDANYRRGMAYYSRFFEHREPDQIAGEVTPNYLYDEKAARRIKRELPEAKLIACLREPVSRCISQYRMEVLKDALPLDFASALRERPEYFERGCYADQLSRFSEFADNGRLLVCFYEDMVSDPVAFYRKLFGFLGVSQDVEIAADTRVFAGGAPRSTLISAGLRATGAIYRPFRNMAGDSLLGERMTLASQWLKNLVLNFNRAPGSGTDIDPVAAGELRTRFKVENEKLRQQLGTLPPSWEYQ
jgi:hypothetical protein